MEIDNFDPDYPNFDSSSSSPISFLSSLPISKDVQRRLTNYLKSLTEGRDEIFMSPIGDVYGPDSILSEWDSIFNSKVSMMNSVLLDLELSNRSKFGPRSIAKPWSTRKEALLKYFNFDRPFTLIPLDYLPVSKSLRPISYKSAVSYLKASTNSGLPYFMSKKSVKPRILSMTTSEIESALEKKYPCILFTRTQEGGKTRDVWGYPIFNTLDEMRYYVPVLKFQTSLSWRSALTGPIAVDRAISELVYKCKNDESKQLISIDFEEFDKSIRPELSSYAFNYIKHLFQDEYRSDLDRIEYSFQNIGLIVPDGVLFGPHGVPSGSTFTNEVDSIVQYLAAKSSNVIDDTNLQIQGDDGVYLIDSVNYETLLDTFDSAGLKVNRTKSYCSRDYCIYLQNLYHIDYVNSNGIIGGIYPTYRALCRILYQERFVDFMDYELEGKDYYSIRTICILENCRNHPLFEDLVRFIYSKDKYLLAFSKSSLSKYSKLLLQGSGTGGVINNQYGDNLSGIGSFKTVEIINSIA